MAMTSVKSSATAASPSAPQSTNKSALAMMTTLFFMWGFLTVLNDILVPHLKAIFDLNYFKVMLIQFAFFLVLFRLRTALGKSN